ncbi:hypothetical protein LX36DRAFT_197850 [Colletotrichum falcatum]|nr:hypothetical protein LX36DRAFT_197850 [Colletotrichum falcatum]
MPRQTPKEMTTGERRKQRRKKRWLPTSNRNPCARALGGKVRQMGSAHTPGRWRLDRIRGGECSPWSDPEGKKMRRSRASRVDGRSVRVASHARMQRRGVEFEHGRRPRLAAKTVSPQADGTSKSSKSNKHTESSSSHCLCNRQAKQAAIPLSRVNSVPESNRRGPWQGRGEKAGGGDAIYLGIPSTNTRLIDIRYRTTGT